MLVKPVDVALEVLWVTMDHLVIVDQSDHVGHEANAVILVHWA